MGGAVVTVAFYLLRLATAYSEETAAVFRVFAENATRFELHTLGGSLGILLVGGCFVGLQESFSGEAKSAAWGRLGLLAAVVGVTLSILGPVIDGM